MPASVMAAWSGDDVRPCPNEPLNPPAEVAERVGDPAGDGEGAGVVGVAVAGGLVGVTIADVEALVGIGAGAGSEVRSQPATTATSSPTATARVAQERPNRRTVQDGALVA